MNMILFALAFSLQSQPPSQESRPLPSGLPERQISPAHDSFFEDMPASSPQARSTLQNFGACVADRSPDLSAQTLAEDFRTSTYTNRLRHVTRVNEDCFRGSRRANRLRSANLLVAGSIAERLLERDTAPVNVQLAHAAARPAPEARSPAEGVALCVVRSTPDDVAALLATEVASENEAAAIRALGPVMGLCNQSGQGVEMSEAGMRAILATAALRAVRTGAPIGEARN
jgi:hypothetical protein